MPTADIDGITLDYEERGNPDDPTVLLIMGLSYQRIHWPDELLYALAAQGLHVVSFDNRDVGASSVLHDHPVTAADVLAAFTGEEVDAPYTLGDMALDALGLLDHLEVEHAHVVGASMGGMIAQHLAFDHAGRVASLTVMMSTTGGDTVGQPSEEGMTVLFNAPPAEREAYLEYAVRRNRIIDSPTMFDEAAVREHAGRVYDRGIHPWGAARQLIAIRLDGDRTERLRRVTAPTLVIHGAKDQLIDVSGGRAVAAAVEGAELVVLDEMGHDIPRPLVPRIADAIGGHIRAAEAADGARVA